MSFEGKVVLITGGSSGIGAACAEYFAKEGALLALVGRNPEKFEILLEKMKQNGIDTESSILIIYADVSVDAERIISETIEKYGRLDVLFNNAGFGRPSKFEDMKMEDYDSLMATNVRSIVQLTQLAVPYLAETKGNIINNSSAVGIIPAPDIFAYSISKAALDQFTKCAGIELAEKGIRVNSINPGYIETDFYSTASGIERGTEAYDEYVERTRLKHPLKCMAYSEDCVKAVAFLANNEDAKFITAILLPIDGGLSTKGAF